jgi:hypothetical protein
MLHRIVVDVVDVPLEIAIIADGVLPETALPERDFALDAPNDGYSGRHDGAGEPAFD